MSWCVKQWRLHSLQDIQPITRKFFGEISEDCNFRFFSKIPKNTRFRKIPVLSEVIRLFSILKPFHVNEITLTRLQAMIQQ